MKVAGGRWTWLVRVIAYSVSGGVASTSVGAFGGALGRLLPLQWANGPGSLMVIAVASLAICRELGWLSLPLPQRARQTGRTWVMVLPPTLVAALWGLDLGLVFTTWLTFSGVWLLVTVGIVVGEPGFGAALFGVYWLGRAVSVWIAPLLVEETEQIPHLLDRVHSQRWLLQRIHAAALSWSVVVIVALIACGRLR